MATRARRSAAPAIDSLIDRHPDILPGAASDSYDSETSEEESTGNSVNEESSASENESDTESQSIDEANEQDFIGKNGFEWQKNPSSLRGRRGRHNVIRNAVGSAPRNVRIESILGSFLLFVTETMLQSIVHHTNSYAATFIENNDGWYRQRWSDIDVSELMAFLACIIFAGVSKSCNESYEELWAVDTGRPFLRACMSLQRFKVIMKFLRFDNKKDREERRMRDKLAAIRDIWNEFIQRCRTCYHPGENCTIDEQLVAFRGRCPFRQYMPAKPARYGMKIWWMTDSRTHYAYNGQVYLGRSGNLPEIGLGQRIVEDLSRPLYESGRNIIVDNFLRRFH